MAQYTLKDAAGADRNIAAVPNTGAQTSAESLSVVPASDADWAKASYQTSQIAQLQTQIASLASILASLQSQDTKTPSLSTGQPFGSDSGVPVRQASPKITRHEFRDTGSSLLSGDFTQLKLGPGMAVSQAYGALTLTTGTTTNAEFMARSTATVKGPHIFRWRDSMSQRILNNVMVVELADLIGTGLAFTTDATGLNITVTFPSVNPFTSANVGQWLSIGAVSGVATYIPGRYAITAVSGLTITLSAIASCTWTRSTTTATVTMQGGGFGPIYVAQTTATVSSSSDVSAIVNGSVTLATQSSAAGMGSIVTFTCLNAGATSGTLTLQRNDAWTASGSGTLTLFGWNSISLSYHQASNTAAWFECFRNGWGAGAVSVTVNGSAAGQLSAIQSDCAWVDLSTLSNSSTTGYVTTTRGVRPEGVPDETVQLYAFIRIFNGTTAPASTTTCTYSGGTIEETGSTKVYIAGNVANSVGRGNKVSVNDMPVVSVATALNTSANGVSTFHHAISAASTNATSVKNTATALSAVILGNTTASVKYWKLYNKASAPTVGTDTPIATVVIPPNGSFVVPFDMFPERLATGLAYAITGGSAVSDTTAVAVGDVTVHLAYA